MKKKKDDEIWSDNEKRREKNEVSKAIWNTQPRYTTSSNTHRNNMKYVLICGISGAPVYHRAFPYFRVGKQKAIVGQDRCSRKHALKSVTFCSGVSRQAAFCSNVLQLQLHRGFPRNQMTQLVTLKSVWIEPLVFIFLSFILMFLRFLVLIVS